MRREHARFCDHWRSKGERRADWTATWRNWMRRAVDYAQRDSRSPRPRSWLDVEPDQAGGWRGDASFGGLFDAEFPEQRTAQIIELPGAAG